MITAEVEVARFPQLQSLCWGLRPGIRLTAREALSLYERNWRFVEVGALTQEEKALIEELTVTVGEGVLHV